MTNTFDTALAWAKYDLANRLPVNKVSKKATCKFRSFDVFYSVDFESFRMQYLHLFHLLTKETRSLSAPFEIRVFDSVTDDFELFFRVEIWEDKE